MAQLLTLHSYNNYIINTLFTLLILRIFPLNFAIFQTKKRTGKYPVRL